MKKDEVVVSVVDAEHSEVQISVPHSSTNLVLTDIAHLRRYQVRIHNAIIEFLNSDKQRAQVYSPTGSGKTVSSIETIKYARSTGKKRFLVVHPRLALSQDQLLRFYDCFDNDVQFTCFHSAGAPYRECDVIVESTTDRRALEGYMGAAKDNCHITFSSYKSLDKIIDVGFDLIIFDESHHFAEHNLYKLLPNIKAEKVLFFTATPVANEAATSYMKDKTKFGEVIAAILPKEVIFGGWKLSPIVNFDDFTTKPDAPPPDPVEMIARAYTQQRKSVVGQGMPFHQMLVAARDVQGDIRTIEKDVKRLKKLVSASANIDVDVWTITGDTTKLDGSPFGKGTKNDRTKALDEIKNSKKDAIIVHYDTLGEGIDIDSLTGCFIMRNLSQLEYIQVSDRCCRLYVEDMDENGSSKEDLYKFNHETNQIEYDYRKKRAYYVTVSMVNGEHKGPEDAKGISKKFIEADSYDNLYSTVNVNGGWCGSEESKPDPRFGIVIRDDFMEDFDPLLAMLERFNKEENNETYI